MNQNQSHQPQKFDFWATKHAIDAKVEELGWSKQQCIGHIQAAYGVKSRLLMSDEQLLDFLAFLCNEGTQARMLLLQTMVLFFLLKSEG